MNGPEIRPQTSRTHRRAAPRTSRVTENNLAPPQRLSVAQQVERVTVCDTRRRECVTYPKRDSRRHRADAMLATDFVRESGTGQACSALESSARAGALT